METFIALLPTTILAVLFIIPCWRIAKRCGFSPFVSLLMLIPIINIIALWVFSKRKWPAFD